VPADYVREFYTAAAKSIEALQQLELLVVEGADHYSLVDAASGHWKAVFDASLKYLLPAAEAAVTAPI